jgi:hypothetical protein
MRRQQSLPFVVEKGVFRIGHGRREADDVAVNVYADGKDRANRIRRLYAVFDVA